MSAAGWLADLAVAIVRDVAATVVKRADARIEQRVRLRRFRDELDAPSTIDDWEARRRVVRD